MHGILFPYFGSRFLIYCRSLFVPSMHVSWLIANHCGAVCTPAKQGYIKSVCATQLIRYSFSYWTLGLSVFSCVSIVRTVCNWPKQTCFGFTSESTYGGDSNEIKWKFADINLKFFLLLWPGPWRKNKRIENVHQGEGTIMLNVLRDRKADVMKGDVRVGESNSVWGEREAGRGGDNKRQVVFFLMWCRKCVERDGGMGVT